MVVDYHDLSLESKPDVYSLFLIDNLRQKQQPKQISSFLDLKHGYH